MTRQGINQKAAFMALTMTR